MRRSPLAVLFLTVFLDLVGFGIVIPLLPFYAERFGATPFAIGVLMASYSLMQFLVAPLWGRLSDRVGRRPVILASVAGSALSLTAFGLATSYGSLLAARAAAGAMGANIAAAQAYVADVTAPADRAKGMGMVGAALGLGFVAGPAIGGFFAQWGFAVPAFVAAGLALVNLALAAWLLPESRRAGSPDAARRGLSGLLDLGRLAARPALVGLLALALVTMVSFAMFESMFGLWGERAHGFDATRVGYVLAFVGVVIAVTQGVLVGPLARRFGPRTLVVAGVSLMGIALAALPLAAGLASVLAALALLAFANGIAGPSLHALVSTSASEGEQGAALGLVQSLGALGRVVGPVSAGLVFAALGAGAPFWFASGGMAVALAVAIVATARATPVLPRAEPVSDS
ncbi:MAG TPA: MFS transporter [Candidatus Thermoplasmatota archaeon]|nr:MFS transporter [Candidatus Thermoplasmatota archaeon]